MQHQGADAAPGLAPELAAVLAAEPGLGLAPLAAPGAQQGGCRTESSAANIQRAKEVPHADLWILKPNNSCAHTAGLAPTPLPTSSAFVPGTSPAFAFGVAPAAVAPADQGVGIASASAATVLACSSLAAAAPLAAL